MLCKEERKSNGRQDRETRGLVNGLEHKGSSDQGRRGGEPETQEVAVAEGVP